MNFVNSHVKLNISRLVFFSSSSSRYEQKMHERFTGKIVNSQSVSAIAPPEANSTERHAIETTNYQQKTHHETTAPYNTSIVAVTQGSGDFNRQAEMSEVSDYFITNNNFFLY